MHSVNHCHPSTDGTMCFSSTATKKLTVSQYFLPPALARERDATVVKCLRIRLAEFQYVFCLSSPSGCVDLLFLNLGWTNTKSTAQLLQVTPTYTQTLPELVSTHMLLAIQTQLISLKCCLPQIKALKITSQIQNTVGTLSRVFRQKNLLRRLRSGFRGSGQFRWLLC